MTCTERQRTTEACFQAQEQAECCLRSRFVCSALFLATTPCISFSISGTDALLQSMRSCPC